MMRLRFIFLISFILSFFLTPLIKKLALKFGVLDYPDIRKIHKEPTPRLGGLAIYLAVILSLSYNVLLTHNLFVIFIASTIIFVLGLVDDIKPVSAVAKLAFQLIAALIVISSGIYIEIFPRTCPGVVLDYLITFIWIIGITNAFNYLDGVDGLAVLLGITILICFSFIGIVSDQFYLLNIIVALGAALLGFLRYNFPRAKIFLGDSGSTFIGFLFAVISIMGSWAQDDIVKIFVPVLILGIPIFDMCFTTFMRITEKKISSVKEWLSYTGRDHFHHRLLNVGFSAKGVVYIICLLSICLGISGIVLYNSERTDAYLMILQATCIFIVIASIMVLGEKTK